MCFVCVYGGCFCSNGVCAVLYVEGFTCVYLCVFGLDFGVRVVFCLCGFADCWFRDLLRVCVRA